MPSSPVREQRIQRPPAMKKPEGRAAREEQGSGMAFAFDFAISNEDEVHVDAA